MKSTMAKVLVGLLALDVTLGVLVTPAGGMDPRGPSGASALTWTLVGIFMIGLILSLTAIVQLVRGSAIAPTIALVAPLLLYPVIIADRSNVFHAEVAPPAIRTLEWCIAALSVVVIGGAAMMRAAARTKPTWA